MRVIWHGFNTAPGVKAMGCLRRIEWILAIENKDKANMKLTDLSQTLTILSAMITPVVLIMASSSLIMSTSQRLSRSIERTRKITDTMNGIIEKMETFKASPEIVVLFEQLRFSSLRARALQNAMSVLSM